MRILLSAGTNMFHLKRRGDNCLLFATFVGMINISPEHINEIRRICRVRHVTNLYLFGSVLTDQFYSGSDIDFLVEFNEMNPEDYSDNYFNFCYDLERVLGRKVDVVTLKSVKNPAFKEVVFSSRLQIFPA